MGDAAPGELRGLRDAHARLAQTYDAPVVGEVRLAAGVPHRPLGNLDALALQLAPGLVVIPRRLQHDPQQ
ncbi:hypothetical protein, partial [Serratia marcescens]|uniref:hypothetical protein n=1 Tax=Serratia marcescens TaxID=615 RepID=UPI0020C9A13C